MSTVAYKGGVMACDARSSNGGEYQTGVMKIGRTKHFLFGYAGVLNNLYPLFDWLCREAEGPADGPIHPSYFYQVAEKCETDPEAGSALIADKDGNLWSLTTDGLASPQPRGFDAIGSGGAYAVGAMLSGASAFDAVQVAVQCDVYSGLPVYNLDWSTDGILRP